MSIRVCYGATGPFVKLALHSAASVFLATRRPDDVVVELFVGSDDLQDAAEKSRRLRREHGWRLDVRPMPLAVPEHRRSTDAANELFMRFVLPELFPDDDCLIYLDADTIVSGDIASLAAQRVGGSVVSACLDLVTPSRIYDHFNCGLHRRRDLCDYFNAGVLVFDCPRWNEMRPAWRPMLEQIERYIYRDQDILNLLLHDAIGRLTDDWNVPPVAALVAGSDVWGETIGRYSRADMLNLERNAKLHHFISTTKPGGGVCPETGAAFERFHEVVRRVAI
jgi:lipopolysaccharide biosynthesis glycosyltransferase